jgi:hypothetical protein
MHNSRQRSHVLHQFSAILTILNATAEVQAESSSFHIFLGQHVARLKWSGASCVISFGKYEFSLGDPKVCLHQPGGDIFLRYDPELFYSIRPITKRQKFEILRG